MKIWQEHAGLLHRGEWHVHTSYTDGRPGVLEYCRRAEELKIPLIAFTEHVRRKLTYDFGGFLSDIDAAREESDLIILSGCEAKVLPCGDLDVEPEILGEVDYPIFAFHSFPADQELFIESLKAVLKSRRVNAWAHPGLFLARNHLNLEEEDLSELLRIMKEHDVLLEINAKYQLPPQKWLALARSMGVQTVRGSDVHYLEALESLRL
ncbi:phosphatase YcdX [uncultured archaeon]|nr:phosphatase YcdX [uncultured archaeon]